jgi:hypothetical protein
MVTLWPNTLKIKEENTSKKKKKETNPSCINVLDLSWKIAEDMNF